MQVATRTATDFRFFKYTTETEVKEWIVQEYEMLTEEWEESSVPINTNIMSHLVELYANELMVRQAEDGDVSGLPSQEECQLAMSGNEDYAEIMDGMLEVLYYNNTFGCTYYGMSDLEDDFSTDIANMMNQLNLFHINVPKQVSPYGQELYEAINSPLQEVW
jgi:hypothetical protein